MMPMGWRLVPLPELWWAVPPYSVTLLHLQIMDNRNFQTGDVDTGFIERVMLAK